MALVGAAGSTLCQSPSDQLAFASFLVAAAQLVFAAIGIGVTVGMGIWAVRTQSANDSLADEEPEGRGASRSRSADTLNELRASIEHLLQQALGEAERLHRDADRLRAALDALGSNMNVEFEATRRSRPRRPRPRRNRRQRRSKRSGV